ncbi:MAG: phage minor head protein [Bacteroidales bacterium]|nr:phage minor head protein [Bacteroidales bacterium]
MAAKLREALIEGYGKDFPDIDFKTPDALQLSHLQNNVYHFSVAKNYQELRQVTDLLKDGDRVRSFGEFKTEVIKLHNTFNNTWLQAEYNLAVNGSSMASRWTQFQGNKEAMPYLIYQTVGDARVRDSHKALDRVQRKIDDDFWKTHYPPNGWNCRCTVNQTGQGSETPTSKIKYPSIQPMFRSNLAEAGLLFPKGHPYYVGIPHGVLRKALAYLPEDAAYITHHLASGVADVHVLHNAVNAEGLLQLANHLEITEDLYKLGYKRAKQLPEIYDGDIAIKSKFYPKDYTPVNIRSNPDTWIKSPANMDMVCDYKYMINTGRTLGEHISKGAGQAEFVVVKLSNKSHTVRFKAASKLIDEKIAGYQRLKGVIILNHDGTLLIEKYR